MSRTRVWFVAALSLAAAGLTHPAHAALRADSLDAQVRRLQAAWDVPGFAVAVVESGQVVLSRGYGVRTLGQRDPVDERTLFYTGSVSKSFTVLALGMLAEQGKLRLDDPVARYLPSFRLRDSVLTGQVTVRDLLAHRTGLPRADLLMMSGYDAPEVVRRLSALDPIAQLRTRFTYQNQMYLVASQLVSTLSGQPFEDFVEQRLLARLGMRSSNARGIGWNAPDGGQATPHVREGGVIQPVVIHPRAPYGGGAINTCAADLTNFLRMLLADGKLDTTKIVSPAVVRAAQDAQTPIPPLFFMPDANLAAYGLGWFLSDYHGEKVVEHGGNAEGWTALVGLLPREKVGVAVLTNMNSTALPYAVFLTVVDDALGRSGKDWAATFRTLERQTAPPEPPRELAGVASRDRYVGTYESPCFGRAEIAADGDSSLVLRYGPRARGRLGPLASGGFYVRWDDPAWRAVASGARASFEPRDLAATSLILDVGSGPTPFRRVGGTAGR